MFSPSEMNRSKNFSSRGIRRTMAGLRWRAFGTGRSGRGRSSEPEGVEHDPGEGAHEARGRDREHPGAEDAAGDAPADTPNPTAGADAHDRAGDDVGRRDRHAE